MDFKNRLLPLTPSAIETRIEHEEQHQNAGTGTRTDHLQDLKSNYQGLVPGSQKGLAYLDSSGKPNAINNSHLGMVSIL